MELLTPGIGLILWQIIFLVIVSMLMMALVHVMRRRIPAWDKALWILLIVCLPLIGLTVYFVTYYTTRKFQRE